LRVVALPLSYLIFMIPIWETLTDGLHQPFQMFSADTGSAIARAFGVPVFREGTYLVLPKATLDVARECSGVNYLIAIAAIGIPLSWVQLSTLARRVALVSVAVLIAIAANGLRVGLIALLSYQGIAGDPHGPWHVFQGLFVAVIGYVVLFAGCQILRRDPPEADKDDAMGGFVPPSQPSRDVRYVVVFAATILVMAAAATNLEGSRPRPLTQPIDGFPATVGGWVGRPDPDGPANLPDADATLVRTYTHVSGAMVHLQVAYFEAQTQGRELVNYKTKSFEVNGSKVLVPVGGGTVAVVETSDEGHLKAHWFNLSGRHALDRFEVKLATGVQSLLHGRTNGAMIIVATVVGPGEDVAHARRRRDEFIAALWPALTDFLKVGDQ
jgi:EpsI family protein